MWIRRNLTSLDGDADGAARWQCGGVALAQCGGDDGGLGGGLDGELHGRDGGALDHGGGHDGGVPVDSAGHSVQRHERHADHEQPLDHRGGERRGHVNSATQTVTLTVTAVNDLPVNTVPGAQTVTEDTALSLGGISVADVEGLATVQLGVLNGTVTVTLSGGAVISAGANGTGTLTVAGSQAAINATLASLVYQGTLNYNGPDTLTVTTTDTNSATDVDTVALTVTAVNDLPVNTVPGAQTVTEDTALSLGGISVADVEGLATVQLGVLNGTVTVTLSGGAVISAGANGTGTLTVAGSQAAINATLASLVYQGTLNYNGPDTLTVTTTDTNSATDVDTVALTVTAVNDLPVNTVPGAQTVTEDTALSLGGISVADVEGLATVQLGVLNGTVTVTLSGGAVISAGANGTGTLTVAGSQAADQRDVGEPRLSRDAQLQRAGYAHGDHDRYEQCDRRGHGGAHGDGGERSAGEHGAGRADGDGGHGAFAGRDQRRGRGGPRARCSWAC